MTNTVIVAQYSGSKKTIFLSNMKNICKLQMWAWFRTCLYYVFQSGIRDNLEHAGCARNRNRCQRENRKCTVYHMRLSLSRGCQSAQERCMLSPFEVCMQTVVIMTLSGYQAIPWRYLISSNTLTLLDVKQYIHDACCQGIPFYYLVPTITLTLLAIEQSPLCTYHW